MTVTQADKAGPVNISQGCPAEPGWQTRAQLWNKKLPEGNLHIIMVKDLYHPRACSFCFAFWWGKVQQTLEPGSTMGPDNWKEGSTMEMDIEGM